MNSVMVCIVWLIEGRPDQGNDGAMSFLNSCRLQYSATADTRSPPQDRQPWLADISPLESVKPEDRHGTLAIRRKMLIYAKKTHVFRKGTPFLRILRKRHTFPKGRICRCS